MQESSFLAAIRADPDDRLARLVYADWLEERDDPRGELIRVEEEMRRLPVFADRFWELKPRRNERRAMSSPEWLAALGYGSVCEPVFRHGVPDGWKERWRLIREFTERWSRIPLPDVGGRLEEIRAAETRLGRTLPPAVREYIAFAHDVRRVNYEWDNSLCRPDDYHDVLYDEYQGIDVDGYAALSLLLQCDRHNGNNLWAVWHQDLTEDDPPVSKFGYNAVYSQGRFDPYEDNPIALRLTSFLLRYTLLNTNGVKGGFQIPVLDNTTATALIPDLEATYPVHATFESIRFFEGDNIHIRLSPVGNREGGPGQCLVVELAQPMTREAIPEFLWDFTHGGGLFHGLFIQDFHPESRSPADDIPF